MWHLIDPTLYQFSSKKMMPLARVLVLALDDDQVGDGFEVYCSVGEGADRVHLGYKHVQLDALKRLMGRYKNSDLNPMRHPSIYERIDSELKKQRREL